ncbi:MAG TPA: 4-hydroxy-tetrahydrodipicolinate reductase [Steroidobacteraceae bacterium]|nr:4-hydroxy-tetrahydrodipicolinate reductase [Steroidobacteraceae bacterium]
MPGAAIFGIGGRMGQCLVRALREAAPQPGVGTAGSQDGLQLSGALASPSSARLGQDAALEGPPTGIAVTSDALAALRGASVAIDFSLPHCVWEHAQACLEQRTPLLVGATGLDAGTHARLETAARSIAVLIAPNTSLGVAVVTHLIALAARALGPGYDAEISEAHHRMKRDAPSGTALAWGAAIARSRGEELSDIAVLGRQGAFGPRKPGSVGFASLRAGDIVGEHTALFAADGERIELTHRASDRMIFARGALRAAAWLVGRPAGLYAMGHVLGLSGTL